MPIRIFTIPFSEETQTFHEDLVQQKYREMRPELPSLRMRQLWPLSVQPIVLPPMLRGEYLDCTARLVAPVYRGESRAVFVDTSIYMSIKNLIYPKRGDI